MDMIAALRARVSSPKLREPGPSAAELELMIRCALRAPDHGLLRPWRFIVFRGDARLKLGEIFVEAEQFRNPAALPDALDRLRRNPLRAPLVLACVTHVAPQHPKIPVMEQVASMAAAVQNLQLAADALGYGAMWRTGPMATDPHVKARLGCAVHDEITAFLHVGTVDGERRRPHQYHEEPDPALFLCDGNNL